MVRKMNTCKNCKNYHPDDLYIGFGECSLMGDANDYSFMVGVVPYASKTRCYGWDYEGNRAGCYVGEDFGCNHFFNKVNK